MVEQKKPPPDPTQRVIVCSMNHTLHWRHLNSIFRRVLQYFSLQSRCDGQVRLLAIYAISWTVSQWLPLVDPPYWKIMDWGVQLRKTDAFILGLWERSGAQLLLNLTTGVCRWPYTGQFFRGIDKDLEDALWAFCYWNYIYEG